MSKDTDNHILLSGKSGLCLDIIYQLNHFPASPSNSKNKISRAFLYLWKKLLVLVCSSWTMILWLLYKLQEFSLLQMKRDHLFQKRFRTKAQSIYTILNLIGLVISHWLHRSRWKWHQSKGSLPLEFTLSPLSIFTRSQKRKEKTWLQFMLFYRYFL